MKALGLALAFIALTFCHTASAWNCSDPLAERVIVPSSTAGTQGDSDGQLTTYNGQVYECEVVPVTPPTAPTTNSSSTANSSSNATASSASNSTASAVNTTKVVANGGNASATGGNATATGGSANQKQGQSQSQLLSNVGNASSSSSSNGNGDNSNNSTSITNVPRSAATAYAPLVAPTTPCFKGYSGGGQGTMFGFSFGGGKIDANCAALEASRLAPSLVARCKVYLTNKYVKAAGVTMDDCLAQPAVEHVQAPTPQPMQIVVNTPAPVVTIIPPPVAPAQPNVVAAAHVNAIKHHRIIKPCQCTYTNDGPAKK